MANNVQITAGSGTTMKTTDNAGVHTPHHNIEIAGTTPSTNSGTKDSGTIRTVQATDDPTFAGILQAEDAAHTSGDKGIQILTVRKDTAAATAGSDGDYQPATTDNTGRLWAHVHAMGGATVNMGAGAVSTGTQRTTLASDDPLVAKMPPLATTIGRLASSANSTNATSVKSSAGTVRRVFAFNTNATVRYLKLYNKGSSPTVGTDTPIFTIPVPAAGGIALQLDYAFGTGIAYALTTGVADSDTGSVGSGDIVGLHILYV